MDPVPLTPDIPQVKVVVPSPSPSSESLVGNAASEQIRSPDISPASISAIGGTASVLQNDSKLAEAELMRSTSQTEVQSRATPIASSSSWWSYIGFGGSASTSLISDAQTHEEDHGGHKAVTTSENINREENTAAVNENVVQPPHPPITPDLDTPPRESCGPAPHHDPVEASSSAGQDRNTAPTPSVFSAETGKSQGSAWYSPWSWYAASPIVPQGGSSADNSGAGGTGRVGEDDRANKTESEMVKEEALTRDGNDSSLNTNAPDTNGEEDCLKPIDKTESEDHTGPPPDPPQPSIPTLISNPIESSISTQRSGWTSFFMSKALGTKSVWDDDTNKLRDRPEHPGEMEVMHLDDEDNEQKTATSEEVSPPPSASTAVAIVHDQKGPTPTPSTPSSPSHKTAPRPPTQEREPKKPGHPAPPLTNSESVKKDMANRPPSPTPSTSTTKKSNSGTSTPQPKAAPLNLVLPTWKDTFLSPPRSNVPPPPTPPSTQRGTLGKTIQFMSGVLFPDATKGKGKEREHSRGRSWEREWERNREKELALFGNELPKSLEVVGQAFDPEKLNEKCRVVVIGVSGWSPGM